MVALQRVLATCGNGHLGRLGHGISQESSKFLRIVGSLVGYEIDQVSCGGAHTAVVTGEHCAARRQGCPCLSCTAKLLHNIPVCHILHFV